MLNIREVFEKYENQFLEHKLDPSLKGKRKDLVVFNMLDLLCPSHRDIVSYSRYDEITLEVSPDDLAKVATEEDILKMIRCGLRYDHNDDCFVMFT